MKKSLKIILSCILLIGSIAGSAMFGCLYFTTSNQIKEKQEQLSDMNEIINDNYGNFYLDSNYKLFWGRWKVTKIIGENSKYGADENAQDLVGV